MLKDWFNAYRYEGQHRGRYQPLPQWRRPPRPVEPVFLGTCVHNVKVYLPGRTDSDVAMLIMAPNEGVTNFPVLADLRSA